MSDTIAVRRPNRCDTIIELIDGSLDDYEHYWRIFAEAAREHGWPEPHR